MYERDDDTSGGAGVMLTPCPWEECEESDAEGWMVQGYALGWRPLCVSPDRMTAEGRAHDFRGYQTQVVPARRRIR